MLALYRNPSVRHVLYMPPLLLNAQYSSRSLPNLGSVGRLRGIHEIKWARYVRSIRTDKVYGSELSGTPFFGPKIRRVHFTQTWQNKMCASDGAALSDLNETLLAPNNSRRHTCGFRKTRGARRQQPLPPANHPSTLAPKMTCLQLVRPLCTGPICRRDPCRPPLQGQPTLVSAAKPGKLSPFLTGGIQYLDVECKVNSQRRPIDRRILKQPRRDDFFLPVRCSGEGGPYDTWRAPEPRLPRREALVAGGSILLFAALAAGVTGGAILGPSTPAAQAGEGANLATEEEVRIAVRKVLSKVKAAGVLRLAFHDAGTFELSANMGGMNGSVVYEIDRPENGGLKRPIRVLEKARLELSSPDAVSWADLMAVGASESVHICGGPLIGVKMGRTDSGKEDPPNKMPDENLSATELKDAFKAKGFSTQEMVVLSGAHTLGSKGFGDPTAFDNTYFTYLLQKPWLNEGDKMAAMIGIPSDRVIANDAECLKWIKMYADSQPRFFDDFVGAFTKLVDLGATWQA